MTAWLNKPLPNGPSNLETAYLWNIDFWKAIRQRFQATGSEFFPSRLSYLWGGGKIDSIAQNSDGTWTITDNAANWVSTNPKCTGPRYYSYSCDPKYKYIPQFYDCIIEGEKGNEYRQLRAEIVGNDSAITIKISNTLDDAVTANLIPSVNSLVGKRVFFIKRGGIWWNDRWLQWPNDYEYDRYTVTSSTATSLTIDTNYPETIHRIAWKPDIWKNKEVLVYAAGKLQRRTITGNTADTLTFAPMPAAPSGTFIIVKAGGRGYPDRGRPQLHGWYTGAARRVWGHSPADSIVATAVAATGLSWESGFGDDDLQCETASTFNVLDVDVWSEVQEMCSEADDPKSPYLFRSFRQLQRTVIDLCSSFVEPDKTYSGAYAIPLFTPARMLKFCGINAGTSSVTGTGTFENNTPDNPDDDTLQSARFSVDPKYNGSTIYYTIVGSDFDNLESGALTAADGLVIIGDRNKTKFNGRSVIYSAGFTRWYPNLVSRIYPRTVFIPDWELKGDPIPERVIYDPPNVADWCCEDQDNPPAVCCKDCFGVGSYITNEADGNLIIYNDDGTIGSGAAIANGTIARYVGDNLNESVARQYESLAEEMSVELPYFDRGYEGNHAKKPWGFVQEAQRADRVGKTTGGTKCSLTDSSKNWIADWFGGAVLRTHSGTLVAGSSTTAKIESFWTSPDDERHCYFDSGRFNGAGTFVGFTLEIDTLDEYGSPVVHKNQITGWNAATQTFSFQNSGVTFSAGLSWRIREYPKVNRYKGKRIKFTNPDSGQSYTLKITGSDRDTVFFQAQSFGIGEGWVYEILELETGGVYRYNNGEWEPLSGNDPRGQDWHENPRENETLWNKAYGFIHKWDWMGPHIYNQLYTAINSLRWTKFGTGKTNRKVPSVAELNSRYGIDFDPSWEPAYGLGSGGFSNPRFNTPEDIWNADWNDSLDYNDGGNYSWRMQYFDYWYDEYYNYADERTVVSSQPPEIGTTGNSVETRVIVYYNGYVGNTLLQYEGHNYRAATSTYGYLEASGIPKYLNCQADLFFYSTVDKLNHDQGNRVRRDYSNDYGDPDTYAETYVEEGYTFNPGSGGGQYRKWTSAGSFSPDANGHVISERIGAVDDTAAAVPESLPVPEKLQYLCDLAESHKPSEQNSQVIQGYFEGWYLYNHCAVLRWDVAGGMTYI